MSRYKTEGGVTLYLAPKKTSFSVLEIRRAIKDFTADTDRIFPGIPCKSGCSACCHENVYVSQQEADLILSYIVKKCLMPFYIK